IDSNFILREALLTIKPISSPHTAENIQTVSLMNNIRRSACSAHTLQLSVLKEKCYYATIYQIIDDVSTRWNSLYLAWIRLKELRKAINYLVIMLPSESERCDQLDDSLILLLKPFYDATTVFSGSNYPIFNLIYPTMKLLIKKFEPSDGQTEDDYADILFGPREQISDQSQFIAYEKDSSESDIEYKFETLSILEQIRKPLHEVPDEIKLIALFLDSRIKNLKFIDNENIKITTINTVRKLCSEEEYHQPLIEEISNDSFAEFSSISISNDLMADLYSNKEPDSISEENKYPILSKFAQKYLSVPSTLVPFERVFSDAGLHITVLRNRLHPNMLEQMMFLKRNKQHFPIFRSSEL
ncbi:38052_t:CDS:2, partial [Gigaspora margarita]